MPLQIAVLYSQKQKGFHVELLSRYLKGNISDIVNNTESQYHLIGIANSYELADKLITTFKTKLNC